jgi:hypothetical protein
MRSSGGCSRHEQLSPLRASGGCQRLMSSEFSDAARLNGELDYARSLVELAPTRW